LGLGSLTYKTVDQPFKFYSFQPMAAFAEFAPLFAAELSSLNEDDMEQWERDYEKIERHKLVLVARDGSARLDKFLLHIDGEEAWFRS
jgi:hypothetical protein